MAPVALHRQHVGARRGRGRHRTARDRAAGARSGCNSGGARDLGRRSSRVLRSSLAHQMSERASIIWRGIQPESSKQIALLPLCAGWCWLCWPKTPSVALAVVLRRFAAMVPPSADIPLAPPFPEARERERGHAGPTRCSKGCAVLRPRLGLANRRPVLPVPGYASSVGGSCGTRERRRSSRNPRINSSHRRP